jgi:hypothetical protein
LGAILVLLVVGGGAWFFITREQQFLRGFAGLLTGGAIQRSAWSVFSGRSTVTGTFHGREVTVFQQLKRRRYGLGYLVVSMRAGGPSTLDNEGIEARTRDVDGRRALAAVANQDLLLSMEEGWLKALWKPVGFVIFPGRFSAEKWRKVLEAMRAVAMSVEAGDGRRSLIPPSGP